MGRGGISGACDEIRPLIFNYCQNVKCPTARLTMSALKATTATFTMQMANRGPKQLLLFSLTVARLSLAL